MVKLKISMQVQKIPTTLKRFLNSNECLLKLYEPADRYVNRWTNKSKSNYPTQVAGEYE